MKVYAGSNAQMHTAAGPIVVPMVRPIVVPVVPVVRCKPSDRTNGWPRQSQRRANSDGTAKWQEGRAASIVSFCNNSNNPQANSLTERCHLFFLVVIWSKPILALGRKQHACTGS
jgi:hypothetical protein